MNDTTEGTDTPVSSSSTAGEDAPAAKAPRWRRVLVSVLVVLACVFAPLSGMAIWIHRTLLNTDQYVATVGPLASDPAVQQAIANRVANTLSTSIDLQGEIKSALPAKAEFIAPYVATGIEQFTRNATLKITQSSQFETLWKEANKRAHEQLVAVLKGERVRNVDTSSGEVTVNLTRVVDTVIEKLHNLGITVFDNVDATRINSRYVLLKSDQLEKAQSGVKLLDVMAIALPIITLVMLGVAIWLSPRRRRTVLHAALGIAFAFALLLIAWNAGRSVYLNALPGDVNRAAAGAAYDQILSFLRNGLRALLVLFLLVAVGAWIAGPGRAATAIRSFFTRLVRGQRGEADREPSPVGAFVRGNIAVFRVLVVAAGVLLLVVLSHPGPLAVLVIGLLIVVGLLLVELLGNLTRPVASS